MMRQQPVIVVPAAQKRDIGRSAQLANIAAGRTVAEIIRTTLGPKAMLKMLLDPMGGIVLTNDGNAILREIDVGHPAAKSLIELSRAQDEEVGDGTTSVVVLAGRLLAVSEPLLSLHRLHPTQIVSGYLRALEDALSCMDDCAIKLDHSNETQLYEALNSCLRTKFCSAWGDLVAKLALKAAKVVSVKLPNGKTDIDTKRFAKVEKVPGGEFEDSMVLEGIMLNKDVTHPKMRRRIQNPRIVLLDCPLEYKKGESQTSIEITKEEDWAKILEQEELEVRKMCEEIIATKCDVVITEKGVSDLAQHFLVKAGISAIRRVRKTDNNRLARITGATIVTRTDELSSSDVGTDCGLFEVKKIGDEYFAYFVECKNPHACTVLLRGGSKDVLNEVERNFQDAIGVARNLLLEAKLLPGGGAIEMEISSRLMNKSYSVAGLQQKPYQAVAQALRVIPETLLQNAGANVKVGMSKLEAQHANPGNASIGINGETGELADVAKEQIWDTFTVKQQAYKTAIEAAAMIIRIDDILSATSKKKDEQGQDVDGDPETFGDSRDG